MSAEKFDSQPSNPSIPATAARSRRPPRPQMRHLPSTGSRRNRRRSPRLAFSQGDHQRISVAPSLHHLPSRGGRRAQIPPPRYVHVVLDSILENFDGINPSAFAVTRAVRLSAQMTGQWREVERTYIIIQKSTDGESTTTRTGRRPNLTREIADAALSDARTSPKNLIANRGD